MHYIIVGKTESIRKELSRAMATTALFGRVSYASDHHEALSKLKVQPVDMIICDWRPATKESVLALLKSLQQKEQWSNIPLVAFASEPTPELRLQALENGAIDCFTQNTDLREFNARIRLQLNQKKRTDELLKEKKKLARLALTDILTGLFNRAYFDATLELETNRSQRTGDPFSLILIDLDHFKRINDNYGHPVGDRVLQSVASILQESSRKSDVVCRFGGEEFAVLLPNTSVPTAFLIAERIRKRIATMVPIRSSVRCPVSVSIGISGSNGSETIQIRRLVEEADCALYASKNNGRNRTETFSRVNPTQSQDTSLLYSQVPLGNA